jgi:phosphoenolpyruvate carboxykinase (GTP)
VNWFRKGDDGKFIWPGFGENMRVLKWIIGRVEGRAAANATPLGAIPRYEDLDWNGLSFSAANFENITGISQSHWKQELALHNELLTKLSHNLPSALSARYQALNTTL